MVPWSVYLFQIRQRTAYPETSPQVIEQAHEVLSGPVVGQRDRQ